MARPEAHFRSRATLEKGKKQIRAANAILNPHGIWADRTRVSNHKPRKGTETNTMENRKYTGLEEGFKSQTPQGDGNPLPRFRDRRVSQTVSNHKPRKGTETIRWPLPMSSRLTSFKSQTPQGDGNHSFDLSSSRKVSVVSNHKPRKGTETILRPRSFSFFISSCFKSQTPQGDGNAILDCTLDVGAQLVSNHKPRKGTETLSWPRSFSFFISSCFKSQTPQGDGNKLVRCPVRQKFGEGFKSQTPQGDGNGQFHFCFLLFGCLFQITNPARGRKPLEIAVRQCHVAKRFKSQTPQGDGNNISRALHQSSTGFQITNPARGRKQRGRPRKMKV